MFRTPRTQAPALAIAATAVTGILWVNQPPDPRGVTHSVPVPASTPEVCTDCGVVLAIRPSADRNDERYDAMPSYEISVRMSDGSIRTYRESTPVFAVGHPVRVTEHGIAPRV